MVVLVINGTLSPKLESPVRQTVSANGFNKLFI